MSDYFDICEDFDAHKCWDLDCYEVEEDLIRDDNGDVEDCILYCGGNHDDINKCPLRKYYYNKRVIHKRSN